MDIPALIIIGVPDEILEENTHKAQHSHRVVIEIDSLDGFVGKMAIGEN